MTEWSGARLISVACTAIAERVIERWPGRVSVSKETGSSLYRLEREKQNGLEVGFKSKRVPPST